MKPRTNPSTPDPRSDERKPAGGRPPKWNPKPPVADPLWIPGSLIVPPRREPQKDAK